jgi:hypothetical protein
MLIDVEGCAATAAGAAKPAARASFITSFIYFLHFEELVGAESRRRRLPSPVTATSTMTYFANSLSHFGDAGRMPLTMRQLLAWPLARRVAPVVGLGVLLGFAAPFASHPPLSAPVRYGFWIGMVLVGYFAALAAEKLVPETSVSRPELRLGAVAIASALPLTFVAAWVIPILRPGHVYQPLQLPALFGPVAAVQLAIVFTLLRKATGLVLPSPAASRHASSPFPPLCFRACRTSWAIRSWHLKRRTTICGFTRPSGRN